MFGRIPRISQQRRAWWQDVVMSPYTLRETVGVVWRNVWRPAKHNPAQVAYLPPKIDLNPVSPVLTLGVIGDIMDMEGKSLLIDPSVREFFRGCDYLLGNFEGTVARKKPNGLRQRHDPQSLDALATMFPPNRTLLNIANNHAADFPHEVFDRSLKLLTNREFRVFGLRDFPYLDLDGDLRIIGGTLWSNQKCDHIAEIHSILDNLAPERCNLLYPHWGYEMEFYPRPQVVGWAGKLLEHADLLIGHHSHVPQPVTSLPSTKSPAVRQLLAYSLGDFCCGLKFGVYQYGLALKLQIGRTADSRLAVGNVEWTWLQCRLSTDSATVSRLAELPF